MCFGRVRTSSLRESSLTKVVHHKYTYKDGKRYGPYLYESKRVDGRVVTSYLGSPTQKFKRRIAYAFLFALLLGVVAFFMISYLHGSSTTGRVAFDVNVVYKEGEPLDGDLKFRIKEGELVPSNAELLISYGGQSKTVPLSELVHDATISGTYYAEGTSLQGEGSGYGMPGVKLEYPTLTFDLLVYSGDESSDVSQGSGDSGANEGAGGELVDGNNEDASVDQGAGTDQGSGGEESGSESGGSQEQASGSESSEGSADSGSDSGDMGGPSISGAFVSESEFTVPAEVSHEREFDYTLSSGQRARIVPDSVRVNGEVVPDSTLSISIDGDEVTVSTDYFISEEGFGEQFLGDYAVTLEVDIEQLGLTAIPGDLGLTLLANNVVVASYKQDVQVAQLPVENATVSSITQIANLPLMRIGAGQSAQIDLGDYFTGAESFDAAIDNMTVSFDGDVITITPQEGFSGSRKAHVVARARNEQLLSNDFTILVSSGAVRITTERDRIVVGQPVRWEKTVVLDTVEALNVELPQDAERITVKKLEGGDYVDISPRTDIVESTPITGGVLTGDVVIEVDLKKESFLKRMYKKIVYAITGNVVEGQEPALDVGQDVVLDDGATQYLVEYYTPAPEATEKNTVSGKQVVISASDELHYSDVIASSELPNVQGLRSADSLAIYWHAPVAELADVDLKQVVAVPDSSVIEEEIQGEMAGENFSADENFSAPLSGNVVNEGTPMADYARVSVPFDAYDLDEDGFIDYVEWVVPHLSNQTYDIVYITDAQHLDGNKTIVSDLTDAVKNLDGVWSEPIPDGHYVRVTYEINLTRDRDITIYPRVVSGNPRVDVYEYNGSTVIASFTSLRDNQFNKIYLAELNGSQDRFDLQVVGGSVEFDQILDPFTGINVQSGSITLSGAISQNVTIPTAVDPTKAFVLMSFQSAFASPNTNLITARVTNSTTITFDRLTTSAVGVEWQVIEGSSFNVQTGDFNFSAASRTTTADLATPVANLNNTFVIVRSRMATNAGNNTIKGYWSTRFVNESRLIFDRGLAGDNGSIGYQVVEWTGTGGVGAATVQSGTAVIVNGTNSTFVPLTTSVPTAQSFLIFTNNGTNFSASEFLVRGDIYNSTTLRFTRFGVRGPASVSYFVVNSSEISVQSASVDFHAAGATNFTLSSPLANLSRSFIVSSFSTNHSGITFTRVFSATKIVNTTTLQVFKNIALATTNMTYFVVSIGSDSVDGSIPISYLNGPANASTLSGTSISFNGTFSDDLSLRNATLFIWNATALLNRTTSSLNGGTSDSVNQSMQFPASANLTWNYYVCDYVSRCAFNSTNFTTQLIVGGGGSPPDVLAPLVSFVSPTPSDLSSQDSDSIFVNLSSSDAQGSHYAFTDFDRSLLLWVRMDDVNATGAPIDLSTWSNNGTNQNGAAITSSGYYNSSFVFDGINDRISFGDVADWQFTNDSQFTISAWVYKNSNGTAVQSVFDKFIGQGYRLFFNGPGCIGFQIRNAVGTISSVGGTGSACFPNEVWTHVSATFSRSNMTLYVNGAYVSSVLASVALSNGTSPAYIGYAPGNNLYFNGSIDEVLLFNRSLSLTEISALYDASATQYSNNFTNLISGAHTFKGYAVDSSANMNQTETRTVTINAADTIPPVVTINSPANRTYTLNELPFLFNVTLNESGGTVMYTLDGGVSNVTMQKNGNTDFNATDASLASGQYTFRVYSNDSAGNRNDTASVVFNFNSTLVSGCANLSSANTVYTLNQSFSTNGNCFQVQADGITVMGNDFILTDSSSNTNNIGLNATGRTNITIRRMTVTGFNRSVVINPINGTYTAGTALLYDSAVTSVHAAGFDSIGTSGSSGGIIRLYNTTFSSFLSVKGGNSTGPTASGDPGTVEIVSSFVNLSGKTIVMSKGVGSAINLNYPGILIVNYTSGIEAVDVRYGASDIDHFRLINATGGEVKWGPYYAPDIEEGSPLQNRLVVANLTNGLVRIRSNFASLNGTSAITLNGAANVTFYAMPGTFVSPVIFKGSSVCTDCTNFTSLNAATVTFNVSDWSGNYTIGEDTSRPLISIVYPTNTTYGSGISALNYTVYDTNLQACWYTLNNGVTNTTITCGANVTGLSASQGSNTWRVYANDTLGNSNSSSVTFSVDSLAPSLVYVAPTESDASYVSRNYILINATATDASLQSIVHLLYNTGNTQINSSNSSLSPLFTNFSGLADGQYYFNSTANDTFGNINRTASRTVTVDTTFPTIVFSPFANNTITPLSRFVFTITVTDTNFANMTFDLYNATTTMDSQFSDTSPLELDYKTDFADGQYWYNVTAIDLAGNTNRSAVYTFTIDTVAPNLTINSPTINLSVPQVTFNITTGEDASAALFSLDNGVTNVTMQKNGNRDFNFTNTSIADGTYTVRFYVNDSVGNLNDNMNRTFSIDTTRPNVQFVSPTSANGSYILSGGALTFNITASDAHLGAISVRVYNGSHFDITNTLDLGGDLTTTSPTSPLYVLLIGYPDGTYYANASANDTLGNVNHTETRTYFSDTTAPNVTLVAPANNSAVSTSTHSFNATFSDRFALSNATFYLWNATALVNTTLLSLSGTAGSLNLTVTLPHEGVFRWNYYAGDGAGNYGFAASNFTITYDGSAPLLSYVTPTEGNGTYVSRTYVLVNATASDANLQSIVHRLYNASHAQVNTSSSATSPLYTNFSGLSDGRYYFNSTANDTLGTINRTATRTVVVDTTLPFVNISTGFANGTVTANNMPGFIIDASDVNYANLTLRIHNSTGLYALQIWTNAPPLSILYEDVFPDGVYTYNATATDLAGNTNKTETRTFTIDTVAPGLTIVSPTNTTYSTGTIVVNISAIGAANVWFFNGTGNESYTSAVSRTFAQGSTTLIAYANDSAGNLNQTSVTFSVDTAAPTIDYVSPTEANGTYLSRTYVLVNVSATDSSLQSIVTRLYNSTGSQVAVNSSSSSSLFSNFSGLSDGRYTFNSTANDSVGNTNRTSSRTVFVDTMRPLVAPTGASPANDSVTRVNTPTFEITVTDANFANTTLNIYNSSGLYLSEFSTNNPLGVTYLDPFADGVYTYNATAYDLASNANSSVTRTFTIDTRAPNFTVFSPLNTTYGTNNITINFTSSDSLAGVGARWFNNGTGNTSYTGVMYQTVSQGSNTFIFYSNDTAGNLNSTSVTFAVDSIAPTVDYVAPTETNNSYINRRGVIVNISASDANFANITIELYNLTSLVNRSSSTSSIYAVNITTPRDGTYFFNATARDSLNNRNYTSTRTFTVDTVAPVLTVLTPLDNQGSGVIYGSSVDFEVESDEELLACNYTIGSGNITMSGTFTTFNATNASIADGLYTATFFCWDYANNLGTVSSLFVVDTTAPVVTINSPSGNLTVSQVSFNVSTDENVDGGRFTLNGGITNVTMQKNGNRNLNYTNGSIADGTYTVRFYVNDTAGNLNSSATRTFTVDTTKPTITVYSPLNTTYGTTNITINFTSSDLNGISARWFNNGTGNTSYTGVMYQTVSQGSHTFVFYSNDSLGNTNSTNVTFIVDNGAPTIDYVSPTEANGTYLSRTYVLVNVTAVDTNLQSIVTRLYNSTGTQVSINASSSSPLLSNFSGLVDGRYTFNSTANDSLGNTNRTQTRTIFIDTLRPVVAFTGATPANNTVTRVNTPSIEVTVTDANFANFTYYLYNSTGLYDSQFSTIVQATFPYDFSPLADGVYTYNATAYDLANNVNSSMTRTLTVDTRAPNFTVFSPLNTTYGTNNITINFTSSDLNGISARWFNNGTGNTTYTGVVYQMVASGSNTFIFYSNDTAGNLNSTSVTFAVDSAAPIVTINSPTGNLSISQVTFNVTTNEDAGAARYTLNNGVTNVTMQKNGNRDFNFTNTSIADGTYTVRFYVNDSVGNVNSSANRTFTVDTTRPLVQFVNPTTTNGTYRNGNSVTFNITATDSNLANISIRVYNASYADITSSLEFTIGGEQSATLTSSPFYVILNGLSDGVFYANASAADTLNNLNYTDTRTYYIDNLAPTVTLNAPTNNTISSSATHSFNTTFSDGRSLANTTFYLWNATGGLVNNSVRGLSGTTGSVNLSVTLPTEGRYYWNYYTRDNATNAAFASSNFTLLYDAGAPTLDYVAPTEANDTYVSRTYVLVNATASDANLQSIVHRLYNASHAQVNTSSSATSPLYTNFSGLSDGRYYFNSSANDTTGNVNHTQTRTLVLDTTLPLINFYGGTPANGSVTTGVTVVFAVNATDTNLRAINLSIYNSSGLYSFNNLSTSPLAVVMELVPQGVYTFSAVAFDRAGNANYTETRTFTVDSTIPSLTITYPQNTSYNHIVTELNYSVSDSTNLSCTYSLDGGETNTIIACGTNLTGLTSNQGSNTWSVTASDGAANQNVSSVTFFVDSLRPSINFTSGTPANGAYIMANLTVNVTASDANLANITIRLYNISQSQTLIRTNVSATSPYALVYTGLADGSYLVNATASDMVGNVNHTESRTVVIDSIAPVITAIISPDEQRSYSGSTINFVVQVNEEVPSCSYTLNGGITNYTMGGGPGEFSATNSTMADGGYTAYFYCTDYAGNTVQSDVNFAVDNVAPAITVNSPNTNFTVSQVVFNITTSETSGGVQSRFTLNGGITNYTMTRTTPGNFNYTNASIADGTYTVRFYVNDSAGNLNSSVTRTFIVDTIKPTITVTSPTNTTYPTTDVPVNFTSADANGISARWFDNGTTNVSYTSATSVSMSQGSHTFVFYSNDSLGNTNSTSVTFSVNSASPTIDYVSPTESNNTYLARSFILVNVTATDGDLQTITNRLYNASVALVNSSTSSSSPHYSNFSGLSDGRYYFDSLANDSVGNTNTTATRTVVVDRTAPNLTFGGSTPSNGSIRNSPTVTIQLAATDANLANLTFRIYNATTLLQTETNSESPIALESDFPDGVYFINGSAIDLAGNVNFSETRTFRIDTIAPNITFVSPTPSNNSYTNSTNVTINVTGFETNRSSVFVALDGTNYTMTCTGSSTFVCNYTFSGLSSGVHTVRAHVNDTAGNANFTELHTFTIDALRPGITYSYGTENVGETVANLTVYMNVSVNESNVANITYSLYNSTSIYNRTTSISSYTMNWTNMPAGSYRYEANITDLANNRNGTGLRTIVAVTSCLGYCSEDSACSLTNRQCYLSSDLCSGGVCDFVNLTMQNSTLYSLYNASGDANVLLINITSNSSTSVRFLSNSTFIFGGKNGTSLNGGSHGGHAGIINITTAGLFNRTQSRFFGIGGQSTLSGAGGNGGLLQVTYHGLIGTTGGWTTSFRAGNSTNSTVGSTGSSVLVKDSVCPIDPDGTNNGIVDLTDVQTLIQLYYGNVSTDDTFNTAYDFNCDGVINVQDMVRIGFQFGRR